jgi:hypothetical protein
VTRRSGLTLLELVLAAGLASLLLVALVGLFDASLRMLARTERGRDLSDASSALFELLERDLASPCTDSRGDLLLDWIALDVDGDGIAHLPVQRLRLVRRAGAAESGRLFPGEPPRERLIEVAWAALPASGESANDAGALVLQRGVRALGDGATTSLFDARFFDARGRPAPGALAELTGGVLWWEVELATDAGAFRDAGTFRDAGVGRRAWDARGLGRPDDELGANAGVARGAGPAGASALASARVAPHLPGWASVALELEPPSDLRRRTRLAAAVDAAETRFPVESAALLPAPGALALVGEEWVTVLSVEDGACVVRRGERGTLPHAHVAGQLVHWGERAVRELPIAVGGAEWAR